MFCSVRHTRVAMSAICIFGLVYLFFVGALYFVVVVEVIEEDVVKDFMLNFGVLIVNSLSSIVPGCVSLQSSLQGNQLFRDLSGVRFYTYRTFHIGNSKRVFLELTSGLSTY